MPFNVQVVVDAAHPHNQAEWWAETLGWELEPTDAEFIRRMVSEGYATDDDTTTHRGALVWRAGAAILGPGPGTGRERRRILFQLVPEPKSVKNRVHLDVFVGDGEVDDVVSRLGERGATVLHRGHQGPSTWVTMTDPEGNEFCVA